MNRTRFENRGILPFEHEQRRVSMRMTTTTHCEHTNSLLVELVVKRSQRSNRRERNDRKCATVDAAAEGAISTHEHEALAVMLCCVVFHKMVDRCARMHGCWTWQNSTGYSTCTFESCNQEVVLKYDWSSHVTPMSHQSPGKNPGKLPGDLLRTPTALAS